MFNPDTSSESADPVTGAVGSGASTLEEAESEDSELQVAILVILVLVLLTACAILGLVYKNMSSSPGIGSVSYDSSVAPGSMEMKDS